MDRFYSLFQTPFYSDGVQRVNMVFFYNMTDPVTNITKTTKIMRVWPCQKVQNESLMLDDIMEGTRYTKKPKAFFQEGIWKYTTYSHDVWVQVMPSIPDYPFIILSGPLKDKINGRNPACSFSNWLMINNLFAGPSLIDLFASRISLKGISNWRSKRSISRITSSKVEFSYFLPNFREDLTFLNTGFIIFFNMFGNLISIPGFWFEINPVNITEYLWEVPLRTDMSYKYYSSVLFNAAVNNDTLRPIKILNYYHELSEYYESTVLLPYNFLETTVDFFCWPS